MNKYNSNLYNILNANRNAIRTACEELLKEVTEIVEYNGGVIYFEEGYDYPYGVVLNGDEEMIEEKVLCLRTHTNEQGYTNLYAYCTPISFHWRDKETIDKEWEMGQEDFPIELGVNWYGISTYDDIYFTQTILNIAEVLGCNEKAYYKGGK